MTDFFDFIKKDNQNTTPNNGQVPTPGQGAGMSASGQSVMPKNINPIDPNLKTGPQPGMQNPNLNQAKNDESKNNGQAPDQGAASTHASPSGQNLGDKSADKQNPEVNNPPKTNGQTVNKPANLSPSNGLDLMTHLTQRSNRVFMTATTKARELGSDLVDSEHILHGLVSDSELYNFFYGIENPTSIN